MYRFLKQACLPMCGLLALSGLSIQAGAADLDGYDAHISLHNLSGMTITAHACTVDNSKHSECKLSNPEGVAVPPGETVNVAHVSGHKHSPQGRLTLLVEHMSGAIDLIYSFDKEVQLAKLTMTGQTSSGRLIFASSTCNQTPSANDGIKCCSYDKKRHGNKAIHYYDFKYTCDVPLEFAPL